MNDESGFDFPLPPFDDMQNLTRMRFLHDMVLRHGHRESGVALEIGVFKGCSTVFLSMAARKRGFDRVYGLDLFTGTPSWEQDGLDTYEEARGRMEEYGLDRFVALLRGDSRELPWETPIDVLHIDGDHSYEGVANDFRRFTPHLTSRGLVVFEDYDPWHPGVLDAVHEALATRDWEVVGVNWSDGAYGSIALRRRSPVPD
ncbi:MAG: class I SAM-dependent methyltransferase [Planctomycetota bacterium]